MNDPEFNSRFGTLISTSTEERLVWSINVNRLNSLLVKSELSNAEIADALISLHIVLETSMNDFFRALMPFSMDGAEMLKTYEELDKVTFIDKARMFILTTDFDFSKKGHVMAKHNKLIKRLVGFSGIRNVLLHGSAVVSYEDIRGNSGSSTAKKFISQDTLNEQVDCFKYIVDAMRFYIGCLRKDSDTKKHLVTYFEYHYFPDRYKNRDPLS